MMSRHSDSHPAPILRDGLERLQREGIIGRLTDHDLERMAREGRARGLTDNDLTVLGLYAHVSLSARREALRDHTR